MEQWNPLQLFFQRAALEDNLPTAKSILNAIDSGIFKVYFLFLSYTLELLTKLNIEFQSENPKVPILLNRMTVFYKTLLRSFVKQDLIETKDFSKINLNDPNVFKPLENIYFGAKLDAFINSNACRCSKEDINNFKIRALDYYVELCKQIRKRFNFADKHLHFASNFAPCVAKSGSILSVANFINLYPNINIDIEAANLEWQMLPDLEECAENVSDLNSFWGKINSIRNGMGELMFSNLMTIVKIILALPHSSAAAERTFSQLSLIKTNLRNRLLIKTIAAILQVKDKMRIKGLKNYQPSDNVLSFNQNILENINV